MPQPSLREHTHVSGGRATAGETVSTRREWCVSSRKPRRQPAASRAGSRPRAPGAAPPAPQSGAWKPASRTCAAAKRPAACLRAACGGRLVISCAVSAGKRWSNAGEASCQRRSHWRLQSAGPTPQTERNPRCGEGIRRQLRCFLPKEQSAETRGNCVITLAGIVGGAMRGQHKSLHSERRDEHYEPLYRSGGRVHAPQIFYSRALDWLITARRGLAAPPLPRSKHGSLPWLSWTHARCRGGRCKYRRGSQKHPWLQC